MSSPMYQLLREAHHIINKQNTSTDYKNYHKIITPHSLGKDAVGSVGSTSLQLKVVVPFGGQK